MLFICASATNARFGEMDVAAFMPDMIEYLKANVLKCSPCRTCFYCSSSALLISLYIFVMFNFESNIIVEDIWQMFYLCQRIGSFCTDDIPIVRTDSLLLTAGWHYTIIPSQPCLQQRIYSWYYIWFFCEKSWPHNKVDILPKVSETSDALWKMMWNQYLEE